MVQNYLIVYNIEFDKTMLKEVSSKFVKLICKFISERIGKCYEKRKKYREKV